MLDTLRVSRRLREAGASELLAEAMAETLSEQTAIARDELATKADLALLDKGLRGELASVRAEVAASESRLDKQILAVENRLLAAQNRLVIWVVGVAVAAAGLAITLLKL